MSNIDWILGQVLFWILVVAIIITGVIGIRRSGAVLAAHQAGLVGGRSAAGPSRGLNQAGTDLYTWWGIEPAEADRAVVIEADADRRSVWVVVRGVMQTLFGESAGLGASSLQRREGFYTGPPSEDGWE